MRYRNEVYDACQTPLLEQLHSKTLVEAHKGFVFDPLIERGRILNRKELAKALDCANDAKKFVALCHLLYGNPSKKLEFLNFSYKETLELFALFQALTGERIPNSLVFLYHLEVIPSPYEESGIKQLHNNVGNPRNVDKLYNQTSKEVNLLLRSRFSNNRDTLVSRYYSSFLEGIRILKHLGYSYIRDLNETGTPDDIAEYALRRRHPVVGLNENKDLIVCIPGNNGMVETQQIFITDCEMDNAYQQYPSLAIHREETIIKLADEVLNEIFQNFWGQLDGAQDK